MRGDQQPRTYTYGEDYCGDALVGERKNQEDNHAFEVINSGTELLAVLADGMGGHAAGEVASHDAVESFVEAFRAQQEQPIAQRLSYALDQANAALAERIAADPDLKGMGCTLVAAHVGPEGMHWISVGDSPLFLVCNRRLTQLNQDHSMAGLIEESYRAGRMSREEADAYPSRNALRSALMGDGRPELIDLREEPLPLARGDFVILASDGLQTLADLEIERIVNAAQGAQDCTRRLLQAIDQRRKPRQDNTTVQVIVPHPSRPGGHRKPTGGRPAKPGLHAGLYFGMLCTIFVALVAVLYWFRPKVMTALHEAGGAIAGAPAVLCKALPCGHASTPAWQPIGSPKALSSAQPSPASHTTRSKPAVHPKDKAKDGSPNQGSAALKPNEATAVAAAKAASAASAQSPNSSPSLTATSHADHSEKRQATSGQ